MDTVVQIGAGSIGRGFLGQLWSEGGFETVFVDVSEDLVSELNRRGSYPLRLVTNDGEEVRRIAPVRAVLASDTQAVNRELIACRFAATAVGARHLASVARSLISPALPRREPPLPVLLCENGLTIRKDFLAGIDSDAGIVCAVETVIGRMVPETGHGGADPLTVCAEPFHELPFNVSQWQGPAPDISGLIPVPSDQFYAYELRKLFLHNGGHALLAYHGYRKGLKTIAECSEHPDLVAELRGFWGEVTTALRRSEYRGAPIFAPGALEEFTDDLLYRFRNPHLGDTVRRVARDPLRKLARDERFVGAANFCMQQGVEPVSVCRAIAAALCFDASNDPAATELHGSLLASGVPAALARYSGVEPDSAIAVLTGKAFDAFNEK